MKEKVKAWMRAIAGRKPGRSKLVYDKVTRTVKAIDPYDSRKEPRKILLRMPHE